MKKWKTVKIFAAVSVFVLIFVSIFTGCFSMPENVEELVTLYDVAQTYGLVLNENESVVSLRRITGTGREARIGELEEWQVFINGELSRTIGKNQTIAFILPNGTHRIYVYLGRGADSIAKSEEITINAQSNLIRLETDITGGVLNQRVNLRQR